MTKPVDWTGISAEAVRAYAREHGWKQDRKGAAGWTYTYGSPRSLSILSVRIEDTLSTTADAPPVRALGKPYSPVVARRLIADAVRRIRRDQEPLGEVANRLRAWTADRAAKAAGAAVGGAADAPTPDPSVP